MDFVLESDSDSAYSPQVSHRTRTTTIRTATGTATATAGLKGYRDLSSAPTSSRTTFATASARSTANGSVYSSSSAHATSTSIQTSSHAAEARSSILKSDLLKAYQSLETPTRISTTNTFIATELPRSVAGRPPHTRTAAAESSSGLERMKLHNIIDSETNGDDTTENLFLHPITLQQPQAHPNGPGATKLSRGGSVVPDEPSLDIELSGVSDAEDLLAGFTTAAASQPRKPAAEASPRSPDGGKLLFVADSSNSELGTPRYRAMREELSHSKTRFRQSINELLNSSPISASYLEKAPAEFRDLVKAGTRMAEVVLGDLESLSTDVEKRVPPASHGEECPQPRKLSTAELLAMNVEAAASTTAQSAPETTPTEAEDAVPNWRIFVHRLGWAVLVMLLIMVADAALQTAVWRQQAGMPIVDLRPLEQFFENLYYRLLEWYPGFLRTANAPH